jgi:fructokinase
MKIGCIEAGGTKFVCGIIDESKTILEQVVIPTVSPKETFEAMFAFFDQFELDAIGVASFGPIDLNRSSKTYGYFTTTPKPGWAFTPFASVLEERYKVPVGFDTDVNGAALAELKYGAGVNLDNLVYYTIGTGIGAGVVVNRTMVHGMMHPEAGHTLVRRHPKDTFEGVCPYHGDCLEGMASGLAMEKRWGIKAHLLTADHEAWDMEAYYIAQACVQAIVMVSPEKIVLGGGVMKQVHLFDLIHKYVKEMLNGYIQSPLIDCLTTYIVAPGLGELSGMLGAYALALEAIEN